MSTKDFRLEVKGVQDLTATIEEQEQYGVITPDGRTQWVTLAVGSSYYSVKELVTKSPASEEVGRFKRAIRGHLDTVGLNYEEYLDTLKFVKRSIVVSVLTPVEVKHPWKAPETQVPF